MKRSICTLFFLLLTTWTPLFAQVIPNSTTLFTTSKLQTRSWLPDDELNRTYIELNPKYFLHGSSNHPTQQNLKTKNTLRFWFEDIDHQLNIVRVEEYFPGIISFIAVNDENGSTLVATVSNDRFTAKYHDHYTNTLKHIRFDDDLGSYYLTTLNVDHLDILSCGHDDLDHQSIPPFSSEIRQAAQMQKDLLRPKGIDDSKSFNFVSANSQFNTLAANLSVANMAGAMYDTTTIDILYVYTQAAEDFAKVCRVNQNRGCESVNNIEELLAQATILSQTALDNSDIPIKLRPVFAYKTDYDETKDEVSSGKRLQRLTTSATFNPSNWNAGGYMEEVHTYRDQYGADLVAGIFSVSDVGGIAWLLNSPGGYPEIGFSLNRVQQVLSGYTLIHEIGHNLGNAHSRSQSANPADIYGGLFHYSVGYQWVTETEAFSSVMAYTDRLATLNGDTIRSVEVPVFSSPEVLWIGVEAGTDSDIFGPTNAARNNREIKQAVANYRITKVNPPSTQVSLNEIQVTMNREDEYSLPILISNLGMSDLMWQVSSASSVLTEKNIVASTMKDNLRKEDDLVIRTRDLLAMSTTSIQSKQFSKADESGVIYQADFEDFKSKIFGGYQALKGWRTNDVKNMFQIKNLLPSSGTNHMRIEAMEEESWYVESPFFGPQGVGVFDVEFDLSVTKDPNTNGFTYADLRFYDASTGELTAGIAVNSLLSILTFNDSETEEYILRDTGEDLISDASSNTYRTIRIRINTTTQRIEYYVDGKQETGSAFLKGRSIDHFYIVLSGGQNPKSYVDIDNIVIRRPHFYNWMDVADYAGTIPAGGEKEILVELNTKGINQGVYTTNLQVITNDPAQTVVNIPVTLTVNSAVSVEKTPELPTKAEISSVYPNPFNPATTIKVNLPSTGYVDLGVYDITGRKIAQLVDGLRASGSYTFIWDATEFASGLYFVRLQSEGHLQVKAITLLK